MKRRITLSTLALSLIVTGHVQATEAPADPAAVPRQAAGALLKTLVGELKKDIDSVGAEGAITVCKDKAPRIAGEIARQHNVQIKRVTFKNRNPERSTPDEWETKALRELEKRLAEGASPANLEYTEVVDTPQGKTVRYMRGLVVQELCMTCHGTSETIPASVKAKLQQEYPNDKATGYLPNQFRGGVSIRQLL
ncbi:MAG: DUF3365 domain-containing protein [Pseudomonadota bacterium]